MEKSKKISYCLFSLLSGICIFKIFGFLGIFIFLTIYFFWLVVYKKEKQTFLFAFLVFVFGMLRYEIAELIFYSHEFSEMYGKKTEISGVVTSYPERFINKQRFIVSSKSQKGKILVTQRLYPEISFGETVSVVCSVKKPEAFDSFQYQEYLKIDNVSSLCYYPKLVDIVKPENFSFRSSVYTLRKKVQKIIFRSLPEPQAGILSAMILGNKSALDKKTVSDFQKSGISHIVAISGLHIGIIAAVFIFLFPYTGLGRKKIFIFFLLFISVYLILIGMPSSALRAALLSIFVSYGYLHSRIITPEYILLWAAGIIGFFSPYVVLYDPAFHLSFSAVIGILFFRPIILFFTKKISKKFIFFQELFAVSLSAQITTAPLILFYFKGIASFSVASNILLVPYLPVIVGLGFSAIFLSLLFFKYSWIFFIPVWVLLEFFSYMSNFFAVLPFSFVEVNSFGKTFLILSYVFLFFLYYIFSRKIQK